MEKGEKDPFFLYRLKTRHIKPNVVRIVRIDTHSTASCNLPEITCSTALHD